jgi:hypothetical protein
MAAVATVAVGALGLIIGWFVSGYQRITEKLTKERRSAYLTLLHAADDANDNPETDRRALKRAAQDSEFICSDQMMDSGRIQKLLAAVNSDVWTDERQRFIRVARYESQNNSYWGRRRRWREYGRAGRTR